MSENKVKKEKYLGKGFLWSSRNICMAASGTTIGYVLVFSVSILGLDAAIIGNLLMFAKVFDVMSNFIIANFVDRHHFKQGKGRAFEICVIPLWLCTFAMYGIPLGWSKGLQYSLIFVLYSLISTVFSTFLYCTDTVYLNRAFKTEKGLITVQSVAGVLQVLAYMVLAVIIPVLMGKYDGRADEWLIISAIIGIPAMLLGMVRYCTIKEVDGPDVQQTQPQITLKDTMNALFRSKYVITMAVLTMVQQVVTVMSNTASTYYFTYIVGKIELMGMVSGISMAGIILIPFCAKLAEKFGKRNVLITCFTIGMIGNFIRLFAGTNMAVIIIGTIMATISQYPTSVYTALMLIECMDYEEYRSGKRQEGAIFAGASLGTTIGNGLGSAIVGAVLSACGFVGTAAVQTDTALNGIRHLYSTIPAAIMLIGILALFVYDLEKRLPDIREVLKERRTKAKDSLEEK